MGSGRSSDHSFPQHQHQHVHLGAQEAVERFLRAADDGFVFVERNEVFRTMGTEVILW